MDHLILRRRLLRAWAALVVAWVVVVTCELWLRAPRVATMQTDLCRWSELASQLLAAAVAVTTWKWFRAKPKPKTFITVDRLRELGR